MIVAKESGVLLPGKSGTVKSVGGHPEIQAHMGGSNLSRLRCHLSSSHANFYIIFRFLHTKVKFMKQRSGTVP